MTYSTAELIEYVDRLPRFRLAHLPTPLEFLPRFSEALGGPRVWIKRDDCTGLAMGGNKTRHNEFIVADALQQGADTVVWGAGVQSNNCRQTAAACAKAGLACHLVLARGDPPVESDEVQGNLLLDHLVGATVEIVDVDVGLGVQQKIAEAADRLRAAGKCVYQNKKAAVKPLAALSYVLCATELVEQTAAADFSPAAAYICSAGSTGAGLTLGLAALGHPFPVRHFTPIVWPWNTREDMTSIANAGAERLGVATRLTPEDIDVSEEFVGAGYGIPSAECLEAISLLARTEGILLDPSYSGKGMAALIDHVRGGRFSSEENVVFVHTGGTPALFAYRDELVEALT